MKTLEIQHRVEQFLYRQSDYLDAKRWQDYIDLFADDGLYWMPPERSYKTWDGQPAIFAEDKNLMNVRMGRVLHRTPGRSGRCGKRTTSFRTSPSGKSRRMATSRRLPAST